MDEPILESEVGPFTVSVYYDLDPESPRDWDNFGTIVCWHRRYDLSDSRGVRIDSGLPDSCDPAVLANWLLEHPERIFLRLYLFDHSGISISLHPFSCPWDSGQVGFWVGPAKHDYSPKQVAEIADAEIAIYDKYLRGAVLGYVVKVTETGEVVDSCWGFYDTPEQVLAEASKDVRSIHTELVEFLMRYWRD